MYMFEPCIRKRASGRTGPLDVIRTTAVYPSVRKYKDFFIINVNIRTVFTFSDILVLFLCS